MIILERIESKNWYFSELVTSFAQYMYSVENTGRGSEMETERDTRKKKYRKNACTQSLQPYIIILKKSSIRIDCLFSSFFHLPCPLA